MMLRRIRAVGVALAVCGAHSLAAQLVPGARVRVRHLDICCEVTTTGTLVSLNPEALAMRAEGDSATVITVQRSTIHSVELSLRTESHIGTGMLVGAVTGFAGTALVVRSHNTCTGDGGPCLAPLTTGLESIAGGLTGLVLGAIVGSQIRSDAWQTIELPARVSVRPRPYGVALSITY